MRYIALAFLLTLSSTLSFAHPEPTPTSTPGAERRAHFHCFVREVTEKGVRGKKCVVTGKVCADFAGLDIPPVRPNVCAGEQPGDSNFHFSCPAPNNIVINSRATGKVVIDRDEASLVVNSTDREHDATLTVIGMEEFTGEQDDFLATVEVDGKDYRGACRVKLAP